MMQFQKHHALQIITLLAALTLSACGGGGGSSSEATTNNTETPAAGGTSGGTTTNTAAATPATPATPAAPTCAPLAASSGVSADNTCGLGGFQSDLISTINYVRSTGLNCGGEVMPPVCPLRWEGQLEAAAARHSTDMAFTVPLSTNTTISHTGSDGTTFRERQPAAGYNWWSGGENIAAGQQSVSDVMAGWMASPSHCKNLMKAEYKDFGVSCKQNAASYFKIYWTMELGVR